MTIQGTGSATAEAAGRGMAAARRPRWLGLWDGTDAWFDPGGLGLGADPGAGAGLPDLPGDALLTCGSLLIELRLPAGGAAVTPLIHCRRSAGGWPFLLSLQAVPGGGLTLVLDGGAGLRHWPLILPGAGQSDRLRLTLSWDAPRRHGRITLEQPETGQAQLIALADPVPLRLADLAALIADPAARYIAPEIDYCALSAAMEPVGPMPGLAPDTPVATPRGFRPAGQLRRGDLVLNAEGQAVPVLHRVTRCVPARGLFRPLRLRAPYFGLRRDVVLAASQRLVLSGSDVEYLFGQEAVLAALRHLAGKASVRALSCGPLTRYTQLVLPDHQAVSIAGAVAESLYLGRLRRRRALLAASLLAGLDRASLPEHGAPVHPVLAAFDAVTLADQRAA